jgi:hypothetical protein
MISPACRRRPTIPLLVGLTIIVSLFPVVCAALQLPPIWDQAQLEDESEQMGSYRILSQIHLDDTNTFMMEEWLNGPQQLFRLDLLSRKEDSDDDVAMGSKKSFIVDGPTQEQFFFEPFRCLSMEPGVGNDFYGNLGYGELFKRFPTCDQCKPLVIGGLGSIWLHALRTSTRSTTAKTAKVPVLPTNRARGRTKFETMRAFNRIRIEPTKELPYYVDFYFVPTANVTADNDDIGPSDLIAIHMLDEIFKKTRLTARIIEIGVGPKSIRPPTLDGRKLSDSDKGVFELPLGYGCARKSSVSHANIVYKPPRNCFNKDRPHVCFLEAASWLPNDIDGIDEDLDKWVHHSTSLRVASGRLLGRSYMAVEESDFVPFQSRPDDSDGSEPDGSGEQAVGLRSMAMRRARRVWDLGPTSDPTEGVRRTNKPIYFELTDHLRSCTTVGHAELNEIPSVEYSLLLPNCDEQSKPVVDTELPRTESASSTQTPSQNWTHTTSGGNGNKKTDRCKVGLALIDDQMLSEFFEQVQDYHLVRLTSAPWIKYQSVEQEKRVDKFEFRDRDGRVAWVGPVSLIRKFHYVDLFGKNEIDSVEDTKNVTESTRPEIPADALRVQLAIMAYNNRLDRKLAHIELTMSPGLLVDEAHFHRELDVEPCFRAPSLLSYTERARMRSPWWSHHLERPSSKDSLDFRLVYPLERPLADEQLAEARSQIYAKFLANLNEESLIRSIGSGGGHYHLNPLQVSRLSVDIEPELVRVTGRLNKWPAVFNFIKRPLARPSNSARMQSFLRELKASEELCAQSCLRHTCPLFAYNDITQLCVLYEWACRYAGDEERVIEYKFDKGSTAYEYKQDFNGHNASPQLLIRSIKAAISQTAGNDDLTNPLAIQLTDGEPGVILVPSSLRVGDELWRRDQILLNSPSSDGLRPPPNEVSADSSVETTEPNNKATNNRSGPDGGALSLGDDLEDELDDARLDFQIEFTYFTMDHRFSIDSPSAHDTALFPIGEAHHLSQLECQELCMENDCRSFSYCSFEKACFISKLVRSDAIKKSMQREEFCFIMIIDYLSKFHATTDLQLDRRLLGADSEQQQPAPAGGAGVQKAVLRLMSSMDCAEACLNFAEFTCKAFLFCRPDDERVDTGERDCFMFNDRQVVVAGHLGQQGRAMAPPSRRPAASDAAARNTSGLVTCDHYQRSYVADYLEFHGKRLADTRPTDEGRTIEILVGVGADDCASACSQMASYERGDGERQQTSVCNAFHVCFGLDDGNTSSTTIKRRQLLCGLLAEDLARSRQNNQSATSRTSVSLVGGAKCTAFVRSGVASRAASKDNDDEQEDERANHQGEKAEPAAAASGGGSSMLGAVIVLLGLAIGYTSAWLMTVLVPFGGGNRSAV